jgi:murein L,D-transpeptidase YcbB/YkuD
MLVEGSCPQKCFVVFLFLELNKMPKNSPRLARSLVRLREQINEQNPNRDKSSDGWIGDTSHKGRKSDHNPNAAGVVTAIDVDENLTGREDSNAASLVAQLQRSGDKRIKYLIYERKITVQGDITKWKAYDGPSPHDHHFHISVSSDPKLYDDASDWKIGSAADASPTASSPQDATSNSKGGEAKAASQGNSATAQSPILKLKSKGRNVTVLQDALVKLGYQLDPDGEFGLMTDRAVRAFQKKHKLTVDGKVGPKTRKALGI